MRSSRSTGCCPTHRHNAGDQAPGVEVHYCFHPYAGMTLAVTRRNVHRGIATLIICQPDGTIGHIPEWMTRPEAASFSLRDPPAISVQCLRDLLDGILSLLPDDSISRGSHAPTTCSRKTTRSVPSEASRHTAAPRGVLGTPALGTASAGGDLVDPVQRQSRWGAR